MAVTECFGLPSSFTRLDCTSPQVGGFTGRAVMIPWALNPTVALTNNYQISSITASSTLAIDNRDIANPFSGSNKASVNNLNARGWQKTFQWLVPHASAAKLDGSVTQAYQGNGQGQGFLLILEKLPRGNGTENYEVLGYHNPFYINDDGGTQNEYENDGWVSLTGSCIESRYEVVFYNTSVAATKTAFEALLNLAS